MTDKKPTFKKGTSEQIRLRKHIDKRNRNMSLEFELIELESKEECHRFKCLIKEGFSEGQALYLIKNN